MFCFTLYSFTFCWGEKGEHFLQAFLAQCIRGVSHPRGGRALTRLREAHRRILRCLLLRLLWLLLRTILPPQLGLPVSCLRRWRCRYEEEEGLLCLRQILLPWPVWPVRRVRPAELR